MSVESEVVDAGPSEPPSPEPAVAARYERAHYRPQLDGLRAVAVYLVVAFHAGIAAFSGGFIGVDVFFVLSGYLVTKLLLRDFAAAGRINLRRFYARRFRRLLPASFVTLIITAIVFTAIASPSDAASALGGFRSAFLYVANWHFIGQSNDYFAANVNTNPVVHFWSLAVEEQFYVLWPLLLAFAYGMTRRAGDRQFAVLRAVVAVAFVISMVGALHIATTNLNRAYYGTDTRAYELLGGALVAMSPAAIDYARRYLRLVNAAGLLGLGLLVLIGTSFFSIGPITRGIVTVAVTCVLLVALEAHDRGPHVRLLSSPTAVYLGQVSYGTYLWHWPVIVVATLVTHLSPWSMFAIACLLGTGLASLSFQVLERPVRQSRFLDGFRLPVIACGLAISLVSGLVIVPAIMKHGHGASTGPGPLTLHSGGGSGAWPVPTPTNLDWKAILAEKPIQPICLGRAVDQCTLVHGTGPKVLLMGDSHARMFIPTFEAIAKRDSLTFSAAVKPNCPWQIGMQYAAPGLRGACEAYQNDWYTRVVPQLDPDIIVVVDRGLDDPQNFVSVQSTNGRQVAHGSPGYEDALTSGSRQALQRLRRSGRKILIIEPIPLAPLAVDPLSCLSAAKYLEDCRYVASAAATPLVRWYRSEANGTSLWSMDLSKLVCPYFPICDPVVNGDVVKRDGNHLTEEFALKLVDPIEAQMRSDGILKR